MAGTSTLSDDFSGVSLDATRWPIAYGTSVSLTGGRLRISCDTTYAGVQSASTYTLDAFSAEPFPPALGGAPADCYGTVMAQSAAEAAGTTAGFFIDRISGLLHCVVWSGYFDAGAVSVTYDATAHAWLHFTYDGLSFVWQSSATQSGARTTLRTLAAGLPAWRDNADFSVYFDTHRDGGVNDFYEIGAINPPEVHPTSGSASLVTTATATGSTSRTAVGTASLAPTATGAATTSRFAVRNAVTAVSAKSARATTRTAVGAATVVLTALAGTVSTRLSDATAAVAVTAGATTTATETHTTAGAAAFLITSGHSESTSRSTVGSAGSALTSTAALSTTRTTAESAPLVAIASADSSGGDPPVTQSLFTTQEPAVTDAADGEAAYSMGTYFTPAVDGTVTHIRWYFPLSAQPEGVVGGSAPKANLFRNSDALKLGGSDAVFDSPGTPGDWNQVALTTAVEVSAGVEYCATIWTPNRYVASTGVDSPWPLTNGDLSAPADAGRFTSGGSGIVDFPDSSFDSGCYFVDVVFTTDAVSEVHTTSGTASLTVAATAAVAGSRPSSGAATVAVAATVSRTTSRDVAGSAVVAPTARATVAGQHSSTGTALVIVVASAAGGGTEEHTSSGLAPVAVAATCLRATGRTVSGVALLALAGAGSRTSVRFTAGVAAAVIAAAPLPSGVHPGPPITSAERPERITAVQRSSRITSETRPSRIL